jgi:DNA invertase Pin-like site-specific DNA recombinase
LSPNRTRNSIASTDWEFAWFWNLSRSYRRREGRRRSRRQAEADRQKLRDETERIIDALFADTSLCVPLNRANGIATIYARYSTDFQHSVGDQIRSCLEAAVRMGLHVPRSNIFYDLAISGSKEKRPGLNGVRDLLPRKQTNVLLVLTTNRLFRKMYKCMKFVEEEVVERGLRCVFVKSGIDTADGNRWRLPLQMNAMVDEMTSTMYAENIRAAQEGLFLQGLVVSTLPFGFTGQDVEGRRTKRNRPRQKIVIHPTESEWVKRMFHWFVVDRLPMARILERLNIGDCPASPKGFGGCWTPNTLRYLLENPTYRGWWEYGKGQNVWQSGADYSKRVMRAQPLKSAQFEHLRLVSDQIWYEAQRLLRESPQRAGRKPRDGNRVIRPRVLNGMLFCAAHDRPLTIAGHRGQFMCCTICRHLPTEERPLHTYLNRRLALRVICESFSGLIRSDTSLIPMIINACQKAIAQAVRPEADRLSVLLNRRDRLTRQIEFILQNPGESEEDRREASLKLKELRAERSNVDSEIAMLEAAASQPVVVPTVQDVNAMLQELDRILMEASTGPDPAHAGTVRAILEKLTGGRIDVFQAGEKRKHMGWVEARLRPRILETLLGRLDCGIKSIPVEAPEITIVIRSRVETIASRYAAKVHALAEEGMLLTQIAERLKIERHQVADALQIWSDRHGLPAPVDGRVRRSQMPQKRSERAVFQAISDEVKQLYDRGLLIEEIAAHVGWTRDTVRAALNYWFSSRGICRPDGRNRRKTLDHKQRKRFDSAPPPDVP